MLWYTNFVCQTYVLVYGVATKNYTTTQTVFGCFEVLFGVILVTLLLKTKEKDNKRKSINPNIGIDLDNDLEKKETWKTQKSIVEHFEDHKEKEPKINVRVKQRTKDNSSNDFKLVVFYQIELDYLNATDLDKIIPSTPRNVVDQSDNDLFAAKPLIEKDTKSLSPKSDKKRTNTVNLNKNFDEILYLQYLVQKQFEKNKNLIRFIQFEQSNDKQPGNNKKLA